MGYVSSLKDLFDVHPKEATCYIPEISNGCFKMKVPTFWTGRVHFGTFVHSGEGTYHYCTISHIHLYVWYILRLLVTLTYSFTIQDNISISTISCLLPKRNELTSHSEIKKTSSWMCLILPRESHKHSCKQHKKGSKLLLMLQKTENLGCTKPGKS